MNKIDQVRPETTVTQAFKRFCEARSRDLVERINQAKEALLADFSRLYGAPSRILRLALSEAEALAWQTA